MKLRFLTLLVGLAVAGSVVAGAAGCASETVASGQTTAHEAIGTDSGVAADGGAATQSGDSTQLDETTADGASSGAAATMPAISA